MKLGETILEVHGLNKYFGVTHANKDIEFTLRRGEVRGLIGENGSGKSTLSSQIAGIYPRDSGEMLLRGEPYDPQTPSQANQRKVSIVVQELGVVKPLPVCSNIFIGRMKPFSSCGIVNMNKLQRAAEEELKKWGLPSVPMRAMAGTLSIETRKIVELARAMSIDPDILILDEVTQSLSHNNRKVLYNLIQRCRELGKAVLVITHDLEEMQALCDTVTVMRDGQVIDTRLCSELTQQEIKRMMVGREVDGQYYREDNAPSHQDTLVLDVQDLNVPGELEHVSFQVRKGEIVGFCGLSDSGIHEVGKAVYGLSDRSGGQVRLATRNCEINSEQTAVKNGVAYVPKDRDNEALMTRASILDNFVLPSLKDLEQGPAYLRPRRLYDLSEHAREEFGVKSTSVYQRMNQLSGGNKQKINLGRWLLKDLDLLILDCPTRGVDVAVKAYIYGLMREYKEKGLAILLISDELTEILGMSDRAIIMKDGKIKGELQRGANFTEEAVIEEMI